MPDIITINRQQGIVEIQSVGSVTKADIASSISELTRIKQEQGIDKVIVDSTGQQTMPGTVDIYDVFSRFPHDLNVAILVTPGQPTYDDIQFLETVAVNRGISIKIVASRDEAMDWLNSRVSSSNQ